MGSADNHWLFRFECMEGIKEMGEWVDNQGERKKKRGVGERERQSREERGSSHYIPSPISYKATLCVCGFWINFLCTCTHKLELRLKKAIISSEILWNKVTILIWSTIVQNPWHNATCTRMPSACGERVYALIKPWESACANETHSYGGITVVPILAKVLEIFILERMSSLLLVAGVPHINQTAYRRNVGCVDAIFATQEITCTGGQHSIHVLILWQKTFDSVEFPVLFNCLFSIGINGKTWIIIKNWYEGGSCCVKLEDRHSDVFSKQRGIR